MRHRMRTVQVTPGHAWVLGLALAALCGVATSAAAQTGEIQEPASFCLAEPGPYHVGTYPMTIEDASRGRRVMMTVWYPALATAGASTIGPLIYAEPDPSDAPYPLIVSAIDSAKMLAPILVSHGFTWVSVDSIDTYRYMSAEVFNQPLDLVLALDYVAANPPRMLQGMFDADHVGAVGYSFDGYNALVLGGARVNPQYYLAQCPEPDDITRGMITSLSSFDCGPAARWNQFVASAGPTITESVDGLWQPITDERILAVMPLACEGWWLFGDEGLAAFDRPALMMVATEDELYQENVLIFARLGAADKTLISFLGETHMMFLDSDAVAKMAHFAVAFFAFHLKGQTDLAVYYSHDFVVKDSKLVWGPYDGEP